MLPGWKLCIRDQCKHKHYHDLINTRTRLSFCSWVLCPLCFGGASAAQGSRGQPPRLPQRRAGAARVAEFCAKSVRVHGIKFLEYKCLVLKYEGIKGVLSKYVKLLDWTTLKVFLKDQQLFKYIDMKLSDNEENIF